MKFKVTLKDSKALDKAITDAVSSELYMIELDENEFEFIKNNRCEKIEEKLFPWFGCVGKVTLEVDTDEDTVVVVKED